MRGCWGHAEGCAGREGTPCSCAPPFAAWLSLLKAGRQETRPVSRGRLHAGPTTDESEVSPPSSGAQAPSTCAPEVHLASAPTSASARSTTTSRRRGCCQNLCFDSPPCGRAQLRAASGRFCPPKTQRRASKPDSTMATAHRPQGVSVYGLKPMHVHDYNLPYPLSGPRA